MASNSATSGMARYRSASNASASPSMYHSTSTLQHFPDQRQTPKHNYFSPEERRHADASWSVASASPHSSTFASPSINYDRDLPALPPGALSDIDTNQLASRDSPRTDQEVRSRHLSHYETAASPLATDSTPYSKPAGTKQSAALRFANASTSAAVSAGLGLKKLGKKASAARLRRPSTSQHAQERDASYAALRDRLATTNVSSHSTNGRIRTPDASYDPSPCPQFAHSFDDSSDPAIGLPYDVSHNVHVDIGPHGYTGLPASWAQFLLSEGMDHQDIRNDPQAAARCIEERTQYLVQRAVENGGNAQHARRVLSERIAADADLSAALASTAPARPNRPRRGSIDSTASSSYSDVLEKGWDLSSPNKSQATHRVSDLPVKSPLLPDFAAEDYDDWATSLIDSIPSPTSHIKPALPHTSSNAADRASHRRSTSLTQLRGANALNGLGIGIAADSTPRRTVQQQRDVHGASNATPKASQRMQASIGLDATAAAESELKLAGTKSTSSVEQRAQPRLQHGFPAGQHDEDDEDVEIARAAIATKGVVRPARASLLSGRKVSPSAVSHDFGSTHVSPSASALDLQARRPHSPRNDASRSSSSMSNTRMSRNGSAESYAAASSRPALVSSGSFSTAPPRIYTENVSTFIDREIHNAPLETSFSGHSSSRLQSPALTMATSSMGHSNNPAQLYRTVPSPSLSIRDSASPVVPPKDLDWRARSPALSISASESEESASSPIVAHTGWQNAKRGLSSSDSGHMLGHQTQDSWTSSAPSITSSEGNHAPSRGAGLRDRRQAPPRIHPPSTSTRWAHIAQQDDATSPGSRPSSGRHSQQSLALHSGMQRKHSADSLVRSDRSPLSDHSYGLATQDSSNRPTQASRGPQYEPPHSARHIATQSAASEADTLSLASQQHRSSITSPTMSHAGRHSPSAAQVPAQDRQRGSVGSVASSRDSMAPPPPPPPKPSLMMKKQPEYILPGADGFYTMPAGSATANLVVTGSAATKVLGVRLRPPPLSPAASLSSPKDALDHQATLQDWVRDDLMSRSPMSPSFSMTSPSLSTGSRDSPLPPLPKDDGEADEPRSMSFNARPSAARSVSDPSAETRTKVPEPILHKIKPSGSVPSGDVSQEASTPAVESLSSGNSLRLTSMAPPRLELSGVVRSSSGFECDFPLPSPIEPVELLHDESSRNEGRGEDAKPGRGPNRKVGSGGNNQRNDTRSIISIGPRAHEDARRFPVSMHYASGFETASMLGDDSEAIRSFRELMLARQSMDLEDMLPMQMGLESAPPVPSLPSMKELEAKVAAAEHRRAQDATMRKSTSHTSSGQEGGSRMAGNSSTAASPSLSDYELELPAGILPPKLTHLQDELKLQPLRKDVLHNMEMIGEGESGPVFAASDVVKKRRVAVKVVHFSSDVDEEPSARLVGLVKEVRVWRRCRHVNILDLYSTVLADGAIWIVQELAERSLADVIAWKDSGVDLNEARMSRVMGDMVEALQFLHSKSVLHRDVRSDNVLISSSGICKLSDFTQAGELSAGVKSRHSVIGTPYWMAPEVIKAASYDVRCDVWSLGVVLWEMIEGDPPRVDFPPLRAITLTATLGLPALSDPASLSHDLKSFLHWATEMDAEKRPSAETLAMSDFLSNPCSRASMVALLEEARNAETEAARLEAGESTDSKGEHGAGIVRQRDSWSSDTTTKG